MSTNEYYNQNADTYINDTFQCDMSHIYKMFFKYMPKSGTILDLGFGSGRDSLNFIKMGFEVYSIDPAEKFYEYGKQIGLPHCLLGTILDFNFKDRFDGVFACASLLHVEKEHILENFIKINESLKIGGVFYSSYKLGCHDGIRNGRYFINVNNEFLEELAKKSNFEILEIKITEDVRNKSNPQWINTVMRKAR